MNETWDHPRIQDINLDWNNTLQQKGAVQVFNAAWEYKGIAMEGLFGTLRLNVWILPRAEGYHNSLLDLNDLETYMRVRDRQLWGPKNEGYLSKGQKQFLILLPEVYDRITINKNSWLGFRFQGQFNFYGYAVGLREDRYLIVKFEFIDNTGGKKRQDWRADAERLREEIAGTLRLEQSPKLPM